ncbi:MAG: DinB family protein [Armatimonadetes bacterium]|nr:DinB family protein [Armatimonadota bacterium]
MHSQFSVAWGISRGRFVDTISDLSDEQMRWRSQPGALTIGEAALHVAGVETMFISQLLDLQLTPEQTRIKLCAVDGAVNSNPFPFKLEEITTKLALEALEMSKAMTEPVITHPTEEVLRKEIISALGPIITGEGALGRLSFHAGYHQGQAYLQRNAPGFPK